jgi:hypothetical protein
MRIRTPQSGQGAALWFAAAHLLRETGKTWWDQVSAQDVQRWTVRLLGLYSDAYGYAGFRWRIP